MIEEASLYHYNRNLRGQSDRIDRRACTVKLYETFQSGVECILLECAGLEPSNLSSYMTCTL